MAQARSKKVVARPKVEPKGRMGAPPFEPTPENRLVVSTMAACGMRQEHICLRVINPATRAPIDTKTLRKHFETELAEAKVDTNAMVAQSLFKKAMGTGQGSVTAAIFWLKCQAGWRDVQSLEHGGVGGGPITVRVKDYTGEASLSDNEEV